MIKLNFKHEEQAVLKAMGISDLAVKEVMGLMDQIAQDAPGENFSIQIEKILGAYKDDDTKTATALIIVGGMLEQERLRTMQKLS